MKCFYLGLMVLLFGAPALAQVQTRRTGPADFLPEGKFKTRKAPPAASRPPMVDVAGLVAENKQVSQKAHSPALGKPTTQRVASPATASRNCLA